MASALTSYRSKEMLLVKLIIACYGVLGGCLPVIYQGMVIGESHLVLILCYDISRYQASAW